MEISESAWAKAKEIIYKDRYGTPTWELLARTIDQERRECAEIADNFIIQESSLWCAGSEQNANLFGQEFASNEISQAIRNK